MPTNPESLESVHSLLAKTKHMDDTQKKQAAEDYLRRGRRFESGREETSKWYSGTEIARCYFEASAKLGNIDAITTMGVYYSKGKGGLPIDEEKALAAYSTAAAAKHGSERAKRNLATYYSRARGGLYQDGETACKLLTQVMRGPTIAPPAPTALAIAPFASNHQASHPCQRREWLRPTLLRFPLEACVTGVRFEG
jgi:TPR repeat protein